MHSKSAQKLYCIKMKWKVTEERFIVYVAILCFVFIINVSAVFCLFCFLNLWPFPKSCLMVSPVHISVGERSAQTHLSR